MLTCGGQSLALWLLLGPGGRWGRRATGKAYSPTLPRGLLELALLLAPLLAPLLALWLSPAESPLELRPAQVTALLGRSWPPCSWGADPFPAPVDCPNVHDQVHARRAGTGLEKPC